MEEEIIKQGVDFSRIAFKEYRDELIKGHLEYAIESHDGKDGDGFIRQMYRIDRYQEEGLVDYCLGRIVDYDVPIKRSESESDSNIEIGSIDLVSERLAMYMSFYKKSILIADHSLYSKFLRNVII